MSNLWRDVRFALRNLARKPVLTAVALLSLALGIGANTAIFSLLNTIILRPLPVPHPEQLVALTTSIPDVNYDEAFTWPVFEELSQRQQVFSELFSWNGGGVDNFEVDGVHVSASLATVSTNYYQAMQVIPLLGRYIGPADVAAGNGYSSAVAVISYRAWRIWFHGVPDIIGRTIRVGSHPFNVIGVEPEGFSGLIIDGVSDVTIPIFAPSSTEDRSGHQLHFSIFGRLRPGGVTLSEARASFQSLWPRVLEATPPSDYTGDAALAISPARSSLNLLPMGSRI